MIFSRENIVKVILAGIAVSALAGCDSRKLATGTIDSELLLRQDSQYQHIAQQYYNERQALSVQLLKETGGTIKDQATYEKYAKLENDLNEKWLSKTREFTECKIAEVQSSCKSVCASKNIDIVLINSDSFPTVEYGAVDITGDILAAMASAEAAGQNTADAQPSSGDGQSPDPEAEKSPEVNK